MRGITEQSLSSPTNIQEKIIPHAILVQNCLFQSSSSSGKTSALIISMLGLISSYCDERIRRFLFVASSGDVAFAVWQRFLLFGKYLPQISCVLCVGDRREPFECEKQQSTIVISTVQRANELIAANVLHSWDLHTIAIDDFSEIYEIYGNIRLSNCENLKPLRIEIRVAAILRIVA